MLFICSEEQLVWLLNALIAFLVCASPDFGDPQVLLQRAAYADAHVGHRFVDMIADSVVRQ